MGFKPVVDLDCESATALGGQDRKSGKKNPTSITGYYIGSRQVDSPKSKTGKAYLHVFQTEKGNQGVWGKTDLDKKILGVTAGSLVRVTFTGMQETKNNPMYKYRVEVDADDAIDVGAVEASELVDNADTGQTRYESGSYEDEGADDEQEADAEEEILDETPPARAAAPRRPATAPSADRAAKVQALLKGRAKTA